MLVKFSSTLFLCPCPSEPPKIMPFSFGTEVMNEGAFTQLSCVVTEGDMPLSISWSFHGHNLTSGLGIQTSNMGPRASILMINSVGHRHRGSYTCTASNKAGKVSYTTKLSVNGTEVSLVSQVVGERLGSSRVELAHDWVVSEQICCCT